MHRRIMILFALTFVPAILPAPASQSDAARTAPEAETIGTRIEAYLKPLEEAGHLSGHLLVGRGCEIVYEKSFGMANFELRVANGPETRFNVASVSKPMTLLALISLASQQKLSLQDKLVKWIPDFPKAETITIEHLARHRAGIPHRVTEAEQETVPRTAAEMVELAKQEPLLFEPGEKHVYSSAGFSVLARVLELASGQSYAELMEEHVFGPAAMPHSAHVDSQELLPDRASSYQIGPSGEVINVPLKDLSFLVGAGSIYSTARDLFELMCRVRRGDLGPGAEGSFVDESGIDWNGVTSGFRTFADWHKESDVTVVYTSNLNTGAAELIRGNLERVVAGDEMPPPTLPQYSRFHVSPGELQDYEGVYEMRPGSLLRVRPIRGGLRVNDWLLIPIAEHRFFSPTDYGIVSVVHDDEGRVEGLDWKFGESVVSFPKVGELDGS